MRSVQGRGADDLQSIAVCRTRQAQQRAVLGKERPRVRAVSKVKKFLIMRIAA